MAKRKEVGGAEEVGGGEEPDATSIPTPDLDQPKGARPAPTQKRLRASGTIPPSRTAKGPRGAQSTSSFTTPWWRARPTST